MKDITKIAKNYNHLEHETEIYGKWERSGAFQADSKSSKEAFTISMPPPNITGQLHIGHALNLSIQDVLIRYNRKNGKEALWLPGTDHAALATEAKIVAKMRCEGVTKEEIGREGFMERAFDWRAQYGGTITKQIRKMGLSCDWSRERFTMDEGLSDAVIEVFLRLYKEDKLYRAKRMVNWCPCCMTSLSDIEVVHKEMNGNLWHLSYKAADGNGELVLATTRPETLLGDVAVAVNPTDERYVSWIGKEVILPIVGRSIPVIADEYVEKDFGTGVVKITPSHDPNDYEIGLRHNLALLEILTPDGHINEEGGKYAGLTREEARLQIVADLEAEGSLVKVETHQNQVGTCDRCGTVVEPRLSLQWFVKMKELAQPAIDALDNGEIRFIPERSGKVYRHWLENINDWCISRQLWWGHRLPVWYCVDCGEANVSKHMPTTCCKCGSSKFVQDEDSLDTWFSSALWPFSTLGWPNQTCDMEKFYPTNVLVTAYDIILFWVVRMVFSGLAYTGKAPFHTIYIHGLIRDELGRKMSKSLNNGIDPLVEIETYGADVLRYALLANLTQGNDQRFSRERMEYARNLINKMWNAYRFILSTRKHEVISTTTKPENLSEINRAIISQTQTMLKSVENNMASYEFGLALQSVTSFFWTEFCDWTLELSKIALYGNNEKQAMDTEWTLAYVFSTILNVFNPFMPFVTEVMHDDFIGDKEALITSHWPKPNEDWIDLEAEQTLEFIKSVITQVRKIRSDMNVAPSKICDLWYDSHNSEAQDVLEKVSPLICRLAGIGKIRAQESSDNPKTAVALNVLGLRAYISVADLIDLAKEVARLEDLLEQLQSEIQRVTAKLENDEFTSRAPAKVVENERTKFASYMEQAKQTEEQLLTIKAML